MSVIARAIEPLIQNSMKVAPIVYVNGPRQAGKTTLVRSITTNLDKAQFLTFDDPMERAAAMRNPVGYLRASGYPLIVDEIQMVPEVFRPLKMLVDEQRYEALQNGTSSDGRYLLTGSANLWAIPELADAMVGRMATITLLPLSMAEVLGQKSSFLKRCFAEDFSDIKTDNMPLTEAISKASFPELLKTPVAMIPQWFQNYIQKITLEDPKYIYNLEKAEFMPILLQALANCAGNLINDANISRDIGLNATTTRSYRNLLQGAFVTNSLHPWHRNITKRLVKSHKMFFHDSMLLCHLLQSTPEDLLKNQPRKFGHLLENFVLSELSKAKCIDDYFLDISFYRTSDGREVDFVLENKGKIVAIEVKHSENITEKDLAGINELKSMTDGDFVCGVVLCNTPRVIEYGNGIYLLPFSALWQ
jgi:predicted AAA+ superfamily ATPase